MEEFKHELNIVSSLKHDNVIQLHGFIYSKQDNCLYIVMELAEMGDLYQYIFDRWKLNKLGKKLNNYLDYFSLMKDLVGENEIKEDRWKDIEDRTQIKLPSHVISELKKLRSSGGSVTGTYVSQEAMMLVKSKFQEGVEKCSKDLINMGMKELSDDVLKVGDKLIENVDERFVKGTRENVKDVEELFDEFIEIHEKCLKAVSPTILEKLKILYGVAKGMRYLHRLNPPLIHRDLKTMNIFLNNDLIPKVADFGLSSRQTLEKYKANVYNEDKNPNWLAPEILLDDGVYDKSSDVYAFGLMIWEVLHNEIAYQGNLDGSEFNPMEVIKELVLKGERPNIDRNGILKEYTSVVRLIENCWKQEMRDRPTFGNVCSILASILGVKEEENEEEEKEKKEVGKGEKNDKHAGSYITGNVFKKLTYDKVDRADQNKSLMKTVRLEDLIVWDNIVVGCGKVSGESNYCLIGWHSADGKRLFIEENAHEIPIMKIFKKELLWSFTLTGWKSWKRKYNKETSSLMGLEETSCYKLGKEECPIIHIVDCKEYGVWVNRDRKVMLEKVELNESGIRKYGGASDGEVTFVGNNFDGMSDHFDSMMYCEENMTIF